MSQRVPAIRQVVLAAVSWVAPLAAWSQPVSPPATAPAVSGFFVDASQETTHGAIVFYACTRGPGIEGQWRGRLRLYAFETDVHDPPPHPMYPVWLEKATVTLSGDVQFTVPGGTGDFEGRGRLETTISGNDGFLSAEHRIRLRREDERHLDLWMVPGPGSLPLRMEIKAATEECPQAGPLQLSVGERRAARIASTLPAAARDALQQAVGDSNSGSHARAKASLERLLRQHPDNAVVRYNYAVVLLRSGDLAKGVELLRDVVKSDTGYPDPLSALSTVLAGAGKTVEARAVAEQAVGLDPTYVDGWYNLAEICAGPGLAQRADEAHQRLEALVPTNDHEIGLLVQSLAHSANRALEAGRGDEARASLERALRWDPYSSLTLRNLGVLAMLRNDVDEAVRVLELARQIEPGYARTWYNLGHAYRQKGNTQSALACFRRYVELEEAPGERPRVENANKIIQELSR